MQLINSRRLAVAGLCAVAGGVAAAPSAQAATVQVDLAPTPVVVTVDTQAIQNDVGALVNDVAALRIATVQRVQSTLSRVNSGVLAPTSARIANVLRQTGVTAFAIVDRSGRVLRGPSAVAVHTRRGGADVRWTNDFSGCLQIALSNTLTPQLLSIDASTPGLTRVTSRSASARASLRNLTVAVIC